jgi:hypothetical protein
MMFGRSKGFSPFSNKPFHFGAVVAVLCIGVGACATYRSWRYPCVSRERGLRGEVMRTAEGKNLYFNGECWTARPTPPTDTPF